MNLTTITLPIKSLDAIDNASERNRIIKGVAVGLVAASIGALYTVLARWGITHGLQSPDLTVLRFGVAGIITLPILILAWRGGRRELLSRWKIWAAISIFAGTPFGLLMFGALQLAPPSHAAVFPFAAMSVMGMLMSAWVLGDKITTRKAIGIAIVLGGLLILSGVDAASFSARALLGDFMFIAAGTLWATFGVMLRKHKLDPLLATAVVSFSALLTYVPAYLLLSGGQRLIDAAPHVFWIEVLVQGVIAGAGTLYTYAKMVSLLGPARAAMFPALAPGIAALLAWPILAHIPTWSETAGLVVAMAGLIIAVTNSTQQRLSR
jgi:drug/metabolite transporter (DMT)-like permease